MTLCLSANAQEVTISAVQDFEKTLGFPKTKNFHNALPRRQAYFQCYSTGILELPDSYDGLRLRRGTESGCKVDGNRDVFFYPVEALAGSAKVTTSLAKDTGERRTVVVAHEDFHALTSALPAPIAEAATTLAGFLTAAEYARTQLGDESKLYRNLSREPDLFLRKAELIRAYHARLRSLYSSMHHGATSTTAALAEKQQAFDELAKRCSEISPQPSSFNRCPPIFNNAGLAFDMTYADYYPVMYEIYLAHHRDPKLTFEALKRLVTHSGAVRDFKLAGSERKAGD